MEKEDRISNLPDPILHHILSFLPSTKQAIRTSILSKRWRKQWTNLTVLIFDLSGKPSDEHHISRLCTSIDNTLDLHESSNLKKFHIKSDWYNFTLDPNYISKLRFPIRKEAEDLKLNFSLYGDPKKNKLPDFFFNNTSLIKLHLNGCSLIPNGRANWECLKDLYIGCCMFSNEAIGDIVSGSPLLESLTIHYCEGFDALLVIASKSLKILVLEDIPHRFFLEIACPNLIEFHVTTKGLMGGHLSSSFYEEAIHENYNLCRNPLHELLELNNSDRFTITHLIIDLNSLKKLVLDNTGFTEQVLISCPNLEDLYLSSLSMETIKFVNIPSSVYATLGYTCQYVFSDNLVRMIFEQLHHVKELNISCCFIRVLSGWEMRGVSSPSINSKSLTLDCGYQFVGNLPGIAHALRTSPELEKLVINMGWLPCRCGSPVSKKKYVWKSKRAVFKCLVSHLKIVEVSGLSRNHDEELEVYGLSRKYDEEFQVALNFVEFLLKNARVLHKMVITLEKRTPDFVSEVSQRLSSFARVSQNVIVELR